MKKTAVIGERMARPRSQPRRHLSETCIGKASVQAAIAHPVKLDFCD